MKEALIFNHIFKKSSTGGTYICDVFLVNNEFSSMRYTNIFFRNIQDFAKKTNNKEILKIVKFKNSQIVIKHGFGNWYHILSKLAIQMYGEGKVICLDLSLLQ